MTAPSLPHSCLRLQSTVTDHGTVEVSLLDVPLRHPGAEEVVVRVEASPINPSDLKNLLAGADVDSMVASGSIERPMLTFSLSTSASELVAARVGQAMPLGTEAAGTVVAAGDSERAQRLMGALVSMAGSGTFAQYATVPADNCVALPVGLTAQQGAAAFVNPLTALGMVDTMQAGGHRGLVHTAAASNLGQMLNLLCLQDDIPLVNIVRSADHAILLRNAGAHWVCDSSTEDFSDALGRALGESGATILFDAIGGGTTAGAVLAAMDRVHGGSGPSTGYGSTTFKQAYLYGNLDTGPTVLHRSFGMYWGVAGWLLGPFLAQAGPERVTELRSRVVNELTSTFASSFTVRLGLAEALQPTMLTNYARRATGGKYLVAPSH